MNLQEIVNHLKNQQVVAYPTEAVFGLGCNPNSQSAVENLLVLKQRPMSKGLILIAPSLDFLLPFMDERRLMEEHWQRLTTQYDRPTTWVVPAKTTTLTSTSANLTGQPPCRTAQEVTQQFGTDFSVLDMPVGGAVNPSEIRDIFTNQVFRQG